MNQPIFYVSLARPPSSKKADEDPVTDATLTGRGKKTKADKDEADKGSKETKGQMIGLEHYRYDWISHAQLT